MCWPAGGAAAPAGPCAPAAPAAPPALDIAAASDASGASGASATAVGRAVNTGPASAGGAGSRRGRNRSAIAVTPPSSTHSATTRQPTNHRSTGAMVQLRSDADIGCRR